MSGQLPKPKILTEFTVSSALTLTLYVDINDSNEKVQATIPAGTYFLAWDNQSDDFLNALSDACYAALDACGELAYNSADAAGKPIFGINSDNKVTIDVGDDENVTFAWTEDDGATVAGILGFDATADLDIDGAQAVADYQPAYCWFASDEGQLFDHNAEDSEEILVAQSRSLSGVVTTQYLASRYSASVNLRHLARADVWSGGTDYAAASSDPYERNRGLECWWRQARQGKRFRIYERSTIDTSLAEERGVASAGTATTITVASKVWETDPQEHAGKLVLNSAWVNDSPMRWYISSHTGDVITVPNGLHNTASAAASDNIYIFDQRYRTYVLDAGSMSTFAPTERRQLGTYDIQIPLFRYQS